MLDELVQSMGVGLVPDDVENSIEGLFLIGQAKALAAAGSFDEAATMQAWPGLATDGISDYEQILQLTLETTEEERRRAAEEAWVGIPPTTFPLLTEALKAIDPRYETLDIPWDEGTTTEWGRTMQGQSGQDAFGGGRTATAIPGYSTNEVFFALFDVGPGQLTDDERIAYEQGRRLLHDSLPAWMDYQIATDDGTFTLDVSVLDGGMLGS